MFWNSKPKCPVTLEDRDWIEEKLDWIHQNLIDIIKQPTILPTQQFFDLKLSGKEEDAYHILNILCDYFHINPNHIILDFYSEQPIELGKGLLVQRDNDGTAGLFTMDGRETKILIEVGQLKMPDSLIATIAHELSHYIIMEEKGYYFEEEENELLTDLTAIAYGFGVFLGNTKFKFSQWSSGDGWGGWSSAKQGYLPLPVIAYALAEIHKRKNDFNPECLTYLKGSFKSNFKKSINYIQKR